jgi:hypothetical protein
VVRDGKVLISDGPFAETKEQIGGYCLIDCKDLDEAIEVASQIPGARTGGGERVHAAFLVMFVLAALGAITAAIAFKRRAPRHIEPEPAPSHVSIVPKAAEESA